LNAATPAKSLFARHETAPEAANSMMITFARKLLPVTLATLALTGSTLASAAQLDSSAFTPNNSGLAVKAHVDGYLGTFTFLDAASTLIDLTGIEITLSLFDGDTGDNQFDAGNLTLGLGDVDTGILLNGFNGGETNTRTFSLGTLNAGLAAQIYADLIDDGALLAYIFDSDSDGNSDGSNNGKNFITVAHDLPASLSLFGNGLVATQEAIPSAATVPEPTTLALCGLGLLGIARSRRRQAT
jgi:hypothetical protein